MITAQLKPEKLVVKAVELALAVREARELKRSTGEEYEAGHPARFISNEFTDRLGSALQSR